MWYSFSIGKIFPRAVKIHSDHADQIGDPPKVLRVHQVVQTPEGTVIFEVNEEYELHDVKEDFGDRDDQCATYYRRKP